MIWFSLLVLIPLAAVVATSGVRRRLAGFVDTITNPQTLAALELTVDPVAAGDRASTW